jgi:hypothetical protein
LLLPLPLQRQVPLFQVHLAVLRANIAQQQRSHDYQHRRNCLPQIPFAQEHPRAFKLLVQEFSRSLPVKPGMANLLPEG